MGKILRFPRWTNDDYDDSLSEKEMRRKMHARRAKSINRKIHRDGDYSPHNKRTLEKFFTSGKKGWF